MKKIIITSLLAMVIAPCAVLAQPHETTYRVECPKASGGVASERLTNFGSYIAGMGELNVDGAKVAKPVCKGIPGAGVPLDLASGGYVHAGTAYNAKTGRATCFFASPINPAFNVSYVLTNAKHGYITKSDNSAITFVIGSGFAK